MTPNHPQIIRKSSANHPQIIRKSSVGNLSTNAIIGMSSNQPLAMLKS
jgi:hypothetical protein